MMKTCARCGEETADENLYSVTITPGYWMRQKPYGRRFIVAEGMEWCGACAGDTFRIVEERRLLAIVKTESEVIK